MQKYTFRLKYFLGILLVFLITSSCKKKKAFNEEDGQSLVDVTWVRSHTDLVLSETNDVISGQFFLRGKPNAGQESQAITNLSNCAYVIDSLSVYSGMIVFNYTGNVCNNLKREGQVVATIVNYPTKKWKDKGSIVKLEFIDYVVTNISENKSLKIHGTEYITNESGGTWYELRYLNQPSVINTITGNDIKVTFDKTDLIFYNVDRRITYTINGSIITASSEGTATQNNVSNIDCWGVNRTEKDFTHTIENSIVWNTQCSALSPISGESTLKVNEKYFDLKGSYGYDSDGNKSNGTNCPNSWKVSWSLRSNTKQRLFNY